jgi:hypothetical protein
VDDLTPRVEPLSASFPESEVNRPLTPKPKKAKARAAAVGRRDLPSFDVEDSEHHELDTMA